MQKISNVSGGYINQCKGDLIINNSKENMTIINPFQSMRIVFSTEQKFNIIYKLIAKLLSGNKDRLSSYEATIFLFNKRMLRFVKWLINRKDIEINRIDISKYSPLSWVWIDKDKGAYLDKINSLFDGMADRIYAETQGRTMTYVRLEQNINIDNIDKAIAKLNTF